MADFNNKNGVITPPHFFPAISVVIPMYNAEKYIGACLNSVLNQTFKDFEVIVVDDCSTDNSCAIVESYIEKFGGRLKLLNMKINSGGPGLPSNKGIAFSRGKYIYVIDNDDLLMNTALETFYNYAEEYGVDVVWTFEVIFYAKSILRIPNPLYLYRIVEDSISHKKRPPRENAIFWANIFAKGIKVFSDFMNQHKFFQDNPQYYFAVLESFGEYHLHSMAGDCYNLSPSEFQRILEVELNKSFGDSGALIAYLCTSANLSHLKWISANQRIRILENQLRQIQGG